jgi:hypothetical protein
MQYRSSAALPLPAALIPLADELRGVAVSGELGAGEAFDLFAAGGLLRQGVDRAGEVKGALPLEGGDLQRDLLIR